MSALTQGGAYRKAKEVAANGDIQARHRLAQDETAAPEILYFLASDEDATVRKAVATNLATPAQADFILSNDTEASIRMDLASKIGKQLGQMESETNDDVLSKVNKVLENLVADQLGTVRSIVAEEVKRLNNVPRGVVNKLARDAEGSVSVPILEHSPLLEDSELVNIIAEGVRDEALCAIARRDNVGSDVAQSITDTRSVPAVGQLLENQTAQLTPQILDDITGLASTNEPLHGPLAGRQDLTEPAMRRMAGFVGGALVEDLISRYPLSPDAQKQLRAAVSDRIDTAEISGAAEEVSSNQTRILLAEDDSSMRTLIRHILESSVSADVMAVADGKQALQAIELSDPFDLIICDWMMPDVSGLDVLQKVRDNGNQTPFIMLTGRKDVDSIYAAQNHGVDAFIAKPVTASELQNKVKVLLRHTE